LALQSGIWNLQSEINNLTYGKFKFTFDSTQIPAKIYKNKGENMSKSESAELILKLYDLRREEKMRDARNWMVGFSPESQQDIMQALINPETSAYYRMVTSYWEMAAALVNHGAIDAEMFADTNGEHFIVFSKIEPFLAEMRETMGNPNAFKNLETLIMSQPDGKERLTRIREMMKRMMQARSEAAQSA
jgi:hypothetical protein